MQKKAITKYASYFKSSITEYKLFQAWHWHLTYIIYHSISQNELCRPLQQ